MAVNPVTRALLDSLGAHPIEGFVADWDALEALVIRVYKNKAASTADEDEYQALRHRISKSYALWQDALQPFWWGKRVGGLPAETDPFVRLVSTETARAIVGDWEAMQTLPAARQALNDYLLDLLEEENGK